jgi:hypothetical protein
MSFHSIRWLAAVLAMLLLQTGCAGMRPVEIADGAALAKAVVVGARVSVPDADGRTMRLEVTAIDDEHLTGRTRSGDVVEARLADVREVRKRQRAPGKTAAFVLSLIAVRVALDDVAFFPQ